MSSVGLTPTGAALDKVLNDYLTKLDATVGTPEYYNLKPLNIVVLTDGVPSTSSYSLPSQCSKCKYTADEPKKVLVDAVARMKAAHHHPNSVAIRIIHIGNDEGAIEALKDLMYGDVGVCNTLLFMRTLTHENCWQNIVDTVPYDGVLTAKKLERILLGGLHPNVRAILPG